MTAEIGRSRYLEMEEVKRLKDSAELQSIKDLRTGHAAGPLEWMVVDTALSTGLRVAEIASVLIKDIDFKRGFIRVERRKRKKRIVDELAVSPEFITHLEEYISGRKSGLLLIGKRGPLTRRGVQQAWQRAVKRAGLPVEYSIHSARHTVAVHLLKRTRNLRQVQKQLGHASPTTTANMYADVSFEDMRSGMTGLYDG